MLFLSFLFGISLFHPHPHSSRWHLIQCKEVTQLAHLPEYFLTSALLGPYGMCSRTICHHVPGIHMIYLANQNDPVERHLQTREDAANQNELRHSSRYDIVTSRWEETICWFSGLYRIFSKQLKDKKWKISQMFAPLLQHMRKMLCCSTSRGHLGKCICQHPVLKHFTE